MKSSIGVSSDVVFVALLASLLVGASVSIGVTTSNEMGELRRVVFAHRHGARTSGKNVSGNCGQIGCAELTVAGEHMLHNLGATFADRYVGKILTLNNRTGRAAFNLQKVQTRSDTSTRCIQSANAFWNGLWGVNDGATMLDAPHLPTIDSSWGDTVNSEAPSYEDLHEHTIQTPACLVGWNRSVDQGLISFPVLAKMAKEMGVNCTSPCPVQGAKSDSGDGCFFFVVGFTHLAISMNISHRYPFTMSKLTQLDKTRIAIERLTHGGYDALVTKSKYHEVAGLPGGILFNAMLGDASNDKLVLSEYSGHDSSLMKLFNAMGNLTFNYPTVGTAVVLEIYEQKKPQSPKLPAKPTKNVSLVVRGLVATPNVWPGTGFPIAWSEYEMSCLSQDGKLHVSSVCPLDDLKRFLLTRLPEGSDPKKDGFPDFCQAYEPDLVATKCMPADPPTAPHCAEYRKHCPFTACGSGRHLVRNLTCVAA